MFRKVKLPNGVSGCLYLQNLHSMSGRYEAFSRAQSWIER